MSEWVDFFVYAVQVVLLWVFLPRQARTLTWPWIADRNPGWIAAHPEAVGRFERSRWFVNTCYLCATACVSLLLMAMLDLLPLRVDAPKWEVMKDLYATFMIIGMLGWFAAWFAWARWLAKYVPLAETRHATLRPRVTSDYVPLAWRIVVEVLTVLHLAVWLVLPALGLAGGADYWSRFTFIVFATIVVTVFAAVALRRPPGYPDRIFGEGFRRIEVRLTYVLRLVPLIPGAMMIGEDVFGLDVDRIGHLPIVCVVSAGLLVVLRLRPVAPRESGSGAERRQTA
jgi:hypothetical protein